MEIPAIVYLVFLIFVTPFAFLLAIRLIDAGYDARFKAGRTEVEIKKRR